MNRFVLFFITMLLASCFSSAGEDKNNDPPEKSQQSKGKSVFRQKVRLPKKLKEISGITRDGAFLWAISDRPKAGIFKLDLSGQVVQELIVPAISFTDVEDIAADDEFIYIADVGDNVGDRDERQIIKIRKSSIGEEEKQHAEAELIRFSFPEQSVEKKKQNLYDCEAIISFGERLYLFTKRRIDKKTELFSVSKAPGRQQLQSIAIFDSKGMITGAAVNEDRTEIALVGYQSGHQHPFIWLLTGFQNQNFFSGDQQHYVLTPEEVDWQIEAIAFSSDGSLYLACEETPDIPSTLYLLAREDLVQLGEVAKQKKR